MSDIAALQSAGIRPGCVVDASGVAKGGTATLAQILTRGFMPLCQVNSTGTETTSGLTVADLANRGIRCFCQVDENGTDPVSGDTISAIQARGILPLAVVDASGVAQGGSTNVASLAFRGIQAFCPIDENGSATSLNGATTFNPSDKSSKITLSNGNLTATCTSSITVNGVVRSVASHSGGLHYCEITADVAGTVSAIGLGLANASESTSNYLGETSNSVAFYSGSWMLNNATLSTGAPTFAAGDVICFAFDLTNKLAWVRNGATGQWNVSATADPATGVGGADFSSVTGPWFFAATVGNSDDQITANFGASDFVGTPPTGFGNF